MRISRCVAVFLLGLLWTVLTSAVRAEEKQTYYFGVLNQRSVLLTAQYWNPILRYVSERSGVPLELRMGKTAVETTAMTVRGEFAFVFTNHLFTPKRDHLGYRVIARPDAPDIQACIAVRKDSSFRSLSDLDARTVVFPSREAFVGYWVPMDALLKSGIKVQAVFGGNQEGAISQLQAGVVEAAAVNSQVLENYGRRENFRYRVIWMSEAYHDLPIMVNPSVPKSKAEAVQRVLIGMRNDPEGRKVLETSAALLKLPEPAGFVLADDRDYDNYRRFYRQTAVNED